jgi:AcrR family transcriptional regulator
LKDEINKTDRSVYLSVELTPGVTSEGKAKTRDKILDAAEALYMRKSFAETSMNDIVAESGLSKGALYNHFKGKEELIVAIYERFMERTLGQLRAMLEVEPTATRKLELIGDAAFVATADRPRAFQAMNIEFMVAASRMEALAPRMAARYTEILSILMDTIQEGVDSGEFRGDVDAGDVAAILFAAADGMTFQYATSGVDFDWRRMKRALIDTALNGILRR